MNAAPFDTIVTYLGRRGNLPFLRWFSNIVGKTISVWGSVRDGVLVADVVCVITVHGR